MSSKSQQKAKSYGAPTHAGASWASTHPGALGLIVLAAFVVICAGIKTANVILAPVVVGVYLAIVGAPTTKWLQTKRVPLPVTVIIVLLGAAVILGGFLTLLVISSAELSQELPRYVGLLQQQTDAVNNWLMAHGAGRVNIDVLDARAALGFAASLLGDVAGVFWDVCVALIVAFFLLLRFGGLQQSSQPGGALGSQRLTRTFKEMNRYIAVKTATSMATGLLIGLWIWLLDGELPALFGMVAFLLNYIPNMGSIIASAPAIAVSLLIGGPWHAAFIALGYVVINVGIGNVLEPRIMGRALGLWPLVVLLSVMFWGWLLGAVGAVLSAILTVMVKTVLLSLEDLRPLGLILGPMRSLPADTETDEAILDETLPQTDGN